MSEIKQINHKFNGQLRQRQRTDTIVVHHSASHDVSAAEIHNWHINQGWAGIGYHFVIRKNGDIQTGRHHGTIGAHAGAKINPLSVAICLTGNFDVLSPTSHQIDALRGLYGLLKGIYGQGITMTRHSDHLPTKCPGSNFDLEAVIKNNANNTNNWADDAIGWATNNNISDGSRLLEHATRQEVITMLYRFNNLMKG